MDKEERQKVINLFEQGLRDATGFEMETKIDKIENSIEGLHNIIRVNFSDKDDNRR